MNKKEIITKVKSSYRVYHKKCKMIQSGGENFMVSNNDLYTISDLNYDQYYSYAPIDSLQTAPFSKFGS